MKNSSFVKSFDPVVIGVVVCFILSGFAALLYQTAWMRQFSLVFGTSELAIAAVLSAYMGGLAFGSSLAARYVDRITRPVLFYGLLEAGIAISALAVPLLLKLASLLYVGILGGQPEPVDASGLGQSFFYLIIAFIVLAIPTSFMGATLPLLTKYIVKTKDQIGSRVGMLYATNTLGAIAGTVVAGFVLLPYLGLNGTVWVGVAINFLVFLLAAFISRSVNDKGKSGDLETQDSGNVIADNPSLVLKARSWILPIMLLSGANSFLYEVLWTRLLGHVLGGSIAAFATMLAGFLSGIAIGSAIASQLAKNTQRAVLSLVIVQCGIALTSVLIYELLPSIIPDTPGLNGNVLLAILVLLPATIFIGATFPLAVRILATTEKDAPASSARIYSWNTVGAILGATAAAFFLIPMIKYEGAIKFAVILNMFLAVSVGLMIGRAGRLYAGAALVLSVATLIFYHPAMPEEILRQSPVYIQPDGEIIYYEVGRSSTVVVIENEGYFNLRNNGLPEASALLKGSPPTIHNQKMLTLMPVLARPDTKDMLVIGLGGGVAIEGVPKSVDSIDVIELESEVVTANEFYGDRREIDPLKDERVNIFINDARSALTLTTKKYDAIVSQPSHPWTAGASHLYTREFMALAGDHLAENGVFLQWMNTQFVDEFLLRSLCKTMLDVYPYVRVYQWKSESLFFLGSHTPLDVEQELALTGKPLSDDPLTYLENGVGSVEDLIAALMLDQSNIQKFAEGGVLVTDNNNYMATMSAKVMDSNQALRSSRLQRLLATYDPLLDANSWFRGPAEEQLNWPYISRRIERLGAKPRAVNLANSLVDSGNSQSLVMIALGQEAQGERLESQKNLLLALQADPSNQQARYSLLKPWFGQILNGIELPEHIDAQKMLLDGTALSTFEGMIAGSKNDMHKIVALDAALASVMPSDIWYETSVKLRAEWRINLTTPKYQPRMANEATALIDSAIVFSEDSSLYSLRIRSSYIAGDILSGIESARILLRRIENSGILFDFAPVPATPQILALNRRYLKQIADFSNAVAIDPVHQSYQEEISFLKAASIKLSLQLDDLENN